MAAGLLLVAAVNLRLAADRLLVRDPWRMGHDRRTELALEPLRDDRRMGVAHRHQDLLAGLTPGQLRGRLLLEHPLERRTHLVEVGLRLWLDRQHQRWVRELERRQDERLVLRAERVAGLGDTQLGDRADFAGPQLADGLLLLAVEQQQLANSLVLATGRIPGVALRLQ